MPHSKRNQGRLGDGAQRGCGANRGPGGLGGEGSELGDEGHGNTCCGAARQREQQARHPEPGTRHGARGTRRPGSRAHGWPDGQMAKSLALGKGSLENVSGKPWGSG